MQKILVEYAAKSHSFTVINSIYEITSVPYLLRDNDLNECVYNENLQNYKYKIFYQEDFKENEIFQIAERSISQRIGWLFPISSIISCSHDYYDNPHYCRYAFIAHLLLILHEIDEKDIINTDFDEIINKMFTEKNAIIFIYENNLTSRIENFNIENYYTSFYKYGYYLKNGYSNHHVKKPPLNKILTVERVSVHLIQNSFISDFFKLFCFEKYPFVKFHILYQIIELLIEDILIYSLEQTIIKFKSKEIYTRSLRDRIRKVESEKDRIILMLDWCQLSYQDYHLLNDSCSQFLESKGRESLPFPESLYSFRNFVVHDFRHMTNEIDTVNEINKLFELFIYDLMLNYDRS